MEYFAAHVCIFNFLATFYGLTWGNEANTIWCTQQYPYIVILGLCNKHTHINSYTLKHSHMPATGSWLKYELEMHQHHKDIRNCCDFSFCWFVDSYYLCICVCVILVKMVSVATISLHLWWCCYCWQMMKYLQTFSSCTTILSLWKMPTITTRPLNKTKPKL